MQQKSMVNLTEGPILKSVAGLALPIMASYFLSTVYSITDMAWIGLLGAKAVAGVGVGGMYVWLSQGFSSLARMGGQVHVAQLCGRGCREEARSYAETAIQLSLLLGLLFSAVCLLFTDPLVGFFRLGDAETIADARIYTRIVCGCILFPFLSTTLTGLYTAQGDSRTPFLANLFGLAANIILDPLLILGIGPFPRMGVSGAAVATVTAQFIVMMVLVCSVFRPRGEGNLLREIRLWNPPPVRTLKAVFRIGFPTALQGTAYCMISMFLTRMVSGFGPEAVATQRVGGQIESVSWNTADGFAAALNAFVGQNYGAGKADRIRKGYRLSFWTMALWGGAIMAVFLLFPVQISGIFFHEELAVRTSADYLRIIGLCEGFMCVELMTVGALSGLGKTKLCSIISISLTAARIPLALILRSTALGLCGVWWALTLTSILKGITFFFAFQHTARRL